ncbi:MAG: autotransporter outer membrane beta-barrel domain-containing protein [Alphaproteobacteria bacterium]|nr:autotransporter outer membrane beta-barrel domain-containing protein [Alphaproteobacteria bacterium]
MSSATAQMPTFTAQSLTSNDSAVSYIFSLVVTDDDGASSSADSVTITVEGPPSVAISGVPGTLSGPTTFTANITFSKPVVGFVSGDITITGGSVTALTGGPSTYTASISTNGTGDLTIQVAAGVAQDGSGNGNEASAAATAPNTLTQNTQDQITSFVQSRAGNILNTTPSLTGFLDGGFGVASRNFNLQATENNLNLAFSGSLLSRSSTKNYAGKFDAWAQLLAVQTDANTASSQFFVGYLGAHRFISQNLLVGGLIQLDYAAQTDSATGSVGLGRGFMLGPYVAGRFGSSNVLFEGQFRWGRSFNNISPIGTYVDGFTTERWMVRGKIKGSFERGPWTISPNLNLSYFNETQAAYVDSLANPIAAQTITLGEISLGSEFSRVYVMNNGNDLNTRIGLAAVTNFAVSGNNGSQSVPLGTGQVRGRIDLGLSTMSSSGWEISASGFYDGIGISGYQSYGGTMKWEIKF